VPNSRQPNVCELRKRDRRIVDYAQIFAPRHAAKHAVQNFFGYTFTGANLSFCGERLSHLQSRSTKLPAFEKLGSLRNLDSRGVRIGRRFVANRRSKISLHLYINYHHASSEVRGF
jgi:hypothetical protein